MPRRPKYRGSITVDTKDCPKCDTLMFKQVKPTLDGMQWVCMGCSHKEDV